jgi:hypothetical protein
MVMNITSGLAGGIATVHPNSKVIKMVKRIRVV